MARMKLQQPWSSTSKIRRLKTASDDQEGIFAEFATRHPKVAERETRTIFITREDQDVPPGEYIFSEAFCSGRRCDCRRAMFMVLRRDLGADEEPDHIVTLGFGWEPLGFYVEWMRGDREGAVLSRGPLIELNGPFCSYGDALLDIFERSCLSDRRYVDRVRRHYQLFKGWRV